MKEFRKYMHIERLGREEVDGVLNGTCYVFPKIDGTNSVVWLGEDGEVHAGSRRQELSLNNDNRGFMNDIVKDENIKRYLVDHPNHYIYGEWLVKHSIGYYKNDAWRKFYIFDVCEDDKYLPYDEYMPVLAEYGIDNVVPLLAKFENPSEEDLTNLLKQNRFLIDDSEERFGEGIVIKNYDFVNKFGRTVFAKIVANEFLSQKGENKKPTPKDALIETVIVNDLLTFEVVEKEYQKLINEGFSPSENRGKFIGMFLNRMWHEFLVEEIATIDKKYRHPVLDLGRLRKELEYAVKENKKELF